MAHMFNQMVKLVKVREKKDPNFNQVQKSDYQTLKKLKSYLTTESHSNKTLTVSSPSHVHKEKKA